MCRLIKFQDIPGFQVQFAADADWYGDLAFAGKGRIHFVNVRRKSKEFKKKVIGLKWVGCKTVADKPIGIPFT